VIVLAVLSAFTASEAGTLAIDFQNPNTLYAATMRGTFKSMDGGKVWAPRNAGLPATTVPLHGLFLVMDAVNSRTL